MDSGEISQEGNCPRDANVKRMEGNRPYQATGHVEVKVNKKPPTAKGGKGWPVPRDVPVETTRMNKRWTGVTPWGDLGRPAPSGRRGKESEENDKNSPKNKRPEKSQNWNGCRKGRASRGGCRNVGEHRNFCWGGRGTGKTCGAGGNLRCPPKGTVESPISKNPPKGKRADNCGKKEG